MRRRTVRICAPLETEDYVVQPIAETSPPKWHLAHTTWFFEHFILEKYAPRYEPFNASYPRLFNSYYKSVGDHWPQQERGALSRPTVTEILAYRQYVDDNMTALLTADPPDGNLRFLVEAGIHHEQQHQELLFMDIKYILGVNPLQPRYADSAIAPAARRDPASVRFDEGFREIGAAAAGFSYDNERPRHRVWLPAFSLSSALVSNAEMLEFIDDGGYSDSRLWLSKGWDWVCAHRHRAPLYWRPLDGQWHEFTLHGSRPVAADAPVCHVSYFEADAFARWRGRRLPTEQELEVFLAGHRETADTLDDRVFHPRDVDAPHGQLWCWTQSHYSAYPGFRAFAGSLGEYNGKFMCNQFVLRGGSCVTPHGHYRHSYRNFFEPHQRWAFTGIRLAGD